MVSYVREACSTEERTLGFQGRSSPVCDVITAGEVEMLEPSKVRSSLGNAAVADARTVAQGQAGEAFAAPGHRH